MAESFTASNEPAKQKRVRGRPHKHPREEDLEVRVEGKELALRNTRKDYRTEASEVIFSLSVPNQLLFQWHRMVHEPRDYIPLLNSSIADKAVAIQSDDSAGGLRSQVATATSGKREALLGRYAHIPVYRGSTVSPQPLLEEVDSLRIELADTLVEMADRQEEITTFIRAAQEVKTEPLPQCH